MDIEREKIDALAEFAAGVGHELNNPLAIISGHAQQLLREEKDPAHRRALATIIAQANRAYEMIADIRLFARPPAPCVTSLDLVELLREALAIEEPLLRERGLDCDFVRDAPELPITSDPVQLRVVIGVLCKNAREAASQGTVRIRCGARSEGSVYFSVEDPGPGIAEDVRPLIFCPYFSGRQAGRGLGFGLSKAYRILEQLGGAIDCEPVDPHGARFVVKLPQRSRLGNT